MPPKKKIKPIAGQKTIVAVFIINITEKVKNVKTRGVSHAASGARDGHFNGCRIIASMRGSMVNCICWSVVHQIRNWAEIPCKSFASVISNVILYIY